MKTTQITIQASTYAAHDDMLTAAAADVAARCELDDWQVTAAWGDADGEPDTADRSRETILVSVPLRWRVYPARADGRPLGGDGAPDYDAAGDGNAFATAGEAREAAASLDATCPVEGGAWAVAQVTR